MCVLAVIGEVEPAALEDEARSAGYDTLGLRATHGTRELGNSVADLAVKLFEIVPV